MARLKPASREADTQSMHIRRTLPVCLLLSVFAASQADAQFRPEQPTPGEDYHIELGMMFWNPTPGIVIGSDSLRAVNAASGIASNKPIVTGDIHRNSDQETA